MFRQNTPYPRYFAQRAETSYARTQVELAQCQYLLPRFWNVDAFRASKGELERGPGKQKLKPTDVLLIEFPIER
jgi:50S ribosomal subunit-associated GTPase HflX